MFKCYIGYDSVEIWENNLTGTALVWKIYRLVTLSGLLQHCCV